MGKEHIVLVKCDIYTPAAWDLELGDLALGGLWNGTSSGTWGLAIGGLWNGDFRQH